jgi:Domain of unknown function (DUF3437)
VDGSKCIPAHPVICTKATCTRKVQYVHSGALCRMNEVLLAVVRAAKYPAPVKTTAVKTLGVFRNSHESAEAAPLQARLPADTWERIVDVAVQSSYFA